MLKGLTNTFKTNCNDVEVTYNEYLILGETTIPIKAKLEDDVYENGNFIGTFIFKTIRFETDATYDFKNKEFEYYKVVDNESIKMGTFITTEVEINDTTEIVKVVGMDYGLKTQVEYSSALDYTSGEVTLLDVWNECCTLCGLTSGINSFPNSNFIVDSDQFSGTGATIRDVFKGIAMSSGTFVKVMNDDKVYLIFNENTGNEEEETIERSAKIENISKIENIKLNGYTKQDTTTGKNLLNYGTQSFTTFYQEYGLNIPAGTYTFSAKVTSSDTSYTTSRVFFYNSSGTSLGYVTLNRNSRSSGTITLSETAVRVTLYSSLDYSSSNGKTATYEDIMLEQGSAPSEYEPYTGGQPSPNPDYPQEVEVGVGKNIATTYATSGNSYINWNFDNSKVTKNMTFSFIPDFTTTSATIYARPKTGGTLYTLGTIPTITAGTKASLSFQFTDAQIAEIKANTGGFIQVYRYNVEMTENSLTEVMLEEGSTATSYLPYNTIEVKSTGKNLCNITSATGYVFNYGLPSGTDSNLIVDSFNSNNITFHASTTGYRMALTNMIQLSPNTSYIIKFDRTTTASNNQFFIYDYDNGTYSINYRDNNTNVFEKTFTTNSLGQIALGFGYGGVSGTTTISNIQIEQGSIATEYEPYKETSIQYNLEDNFVADKDYIENGVLHKNTRHIQLKVSDMNNNEDYPGWKNITQIHDDYPNENIVLSSITNYWCNICGYNTNAGVAINTNNGNGTIFLPKSQYGSNFTQTYWKTNYPDLVVDIYYELAEETTEELETTGELRTFGAVTNISTDMELEFTYYDNQFETIDDYVELEDKRDTHPWTCLRLGSSQVDGDNIDYIDDELVEEYGENWLILNDNPFAYTQEKKQALITAIYNQIKEFGYSAFVSKTSFKPYLTTGDLIRFKNRNGNYVSSILLRYNHDYENIELSAPSETTATINYVRPLSEVQAIKNIQIIVDQEKEQITSAVQQINSLGQLVDSQGEQITALGTTITQNVQSITASVTAIQEELDNGVNLVKTTSVTINDDGLNVSTDTSNISTTMTNDAFEIRASGYSDPLAYFGYDTDDNTTKSKMDNLTVTNYLVTGYHRIQTWEEPDNNEERTGFFWIGE